jgi:hypothetical protein
MKSSRRHGAQVKSTPPYRPTPTACPTCRSEPFRSARRAAITRRLSEVSGDVGAPGPLTARPRPDQPPRGSPDRHRPRGPDARDYQHGEEAMRRRIYHSEAAVGAGQHGRVHPGRMAIPVLSGSREGPAPASPMSSAPAEAGLREQRPEESNVHEGPFVRQLVGAQDLDGPGGRPRCWSCGLDTTRLVTTTCHALIDGMAIQSGNRIQPDLDSLQYFG